MYLARLFILLLSMSQVRGHRKKTSAQQLLEWPIVAKSRPEFKTVPAESATSSEGFLVMRQFRVATEICSLQLRYDYYISP